ncbi:hypothetical protein Taro_049927 [Colocasia esculenta]|uniref:Scarecrow-like protein 18 n=1 Tax=Colocasia esculenta TaxID=4460 RepID=A0A843XC36_COLES|nr:hypothetical protein [Colocasia esculenta]
MLSSLNSHEEEDDRDHLPPHHHHHPNPSPGFVTQTGHIRDLLITCADLISRGNLAAARHAVSLISASASPCGDAIDRLANVFSRALSIRVSRLALVAASAAPASPPPDPDALGSAYLLLNQVTPFIRFCHLTANQAILEAVDGRRSVHILDFDTAQGVQWPPLLQAIAERWANPASRPSIRITGTGSDLDMLHRTGERLKSFAQTLGLRFQFFPLLLPSTGILSSSSSSSAAITGVSSTGSSGFINLSAFQLHPGETLAVNCVLFLHKLLRPDDVGDGWRELRPFLRSLRAMNPAVVTVAEREASHNSPPFLHRFTEALDHYAAMFESLEATLPASSQERLTVEQVWFGREVTDVVAGEGEERRERHERFDRWERAMWSAGFSNLPLSPFALSQAKLLLRIHYPLEGYQLQMMKDSLFLGWRGRPLFSVSSWRP